MNNRKIRISLDGGRTWVEIDGRHTPPQVETEISFEFNLPEKSEVTGYQIDWTPGEGAAAPLTGFGFTVKIPRDGYEWQRPRNKPELS